ncbi:phospholipid phosphatase 5-like isoform X2 [Mytilus galloprovincialis]|uniref:phospholipid phosphatase 5-like isoform X2 n=1 Tax=Mytilus galloprovincialis TaxID=29158 RepID=UPI003F7BF2FC
MTVVNKSQKLAVEIGVRLFLFVFFYISDDATPYFRKIQPEEFWLYRFPRTPSFYPGYLLWITILGVPTIVATVYFIKHRDKTDWQQAILGVVLSIYLTASVTNCIKLAVGSIRDFTSYLVA